MDFRYTPQQEAFREQLSAWLDHNMAEVFGENRDPLGQADEDGERRWQRTREWHRRLYEASYVALHWPKE